MRHVLKATVIAFSSFAPVLVVLGQWDEALQGHFVDWF